MYPLLTQIVSDLWCAVMQAIADDDVICTCSLWHAAIHSFTDGVELIAPRDLMSMSGTAFRGGLPHVKAVL